MSSYPTQKYQLAEACKFIAKQETYKGRRRRLSHKPASKGLLNIAESTFWKMIRRGDFPKPIYLTASMPTWTESQIKAWLESKSPKAA